jgi:hypothetical protein
MSAGTVRKRRELPRSHPQVRRYAGRIARGQRHPLHKTRPTGRLTPPEHVVVVAFLLGVAVATAHRGVDAGPGR